MSEQWQLSSLCTVQHSGDTAGVTGLYLAVILAVAVLQVGNVPVYGERGGDHVVLDVHVAGRSLLEILPVDGGDGYGLLASADVSAHRLFSQELRLPLVHQFLLSQFRRLLYRPI